MEKLQNTESTSVHGSLFAVMHASFHASVMRPALQAGPLQESAGVGQVSECCVALINEACMSMLHYLPLE